MKVVMFVLCALAMLALVWSAMAAVLSYSTAELTQLGVPRLSWWESLCALVALTMVGAAWSTSLAAAVGRLKK